CYVLTAMEQPKTLLEAIQYFSDEQVCIDAVALMRWPDGPRCPDCIGENGKRPYYIQSQKRWKCRYCRRQFSVKVGTIFEDSPIPLQKWLPALWMMVNCKNGVSSWELHRSLGITQKSAWFVAHRLRLALKNNSLFKIGGSDGGPVEVDETFIGGQKKNMHASKKLRYEAAGGIKAKTAVMGFLDRELRQVRTKIVPNVKRETLQNEVLNHVRYGSAVYTDQAVTYDLLHSRFVHDVVNKVESYVNGQVHVNGVENFWSCLKRSLKGTYIAVEPFHLERYLDEQMFRFNNRATRDNPLNDSDRFVAALAQVAGKRLTYKELTAKTDDTTPF
ncbi:MAG: IS1595 family transposase, partial [Candidatus Korobacteraceae bacterium]